jgi:hypothetical protein
MSKGQYKTGVRYCMETWPENVILRVGAAVAQEGLKGTTWRQGRPRPCHGLQCSK